MYFQILKAEIELRFVLLTVCEDVLAETNITNIYSSFSDNILSNSTSRDKF